MAFLKFKFVFYLIFRISVFRALDSFDGLLCGEHRLKTQAVLVGNIL